MTGFRYDAPLKQILGYLAVRPTGASSDQMMAAVWPDVHPRSSRNRFHTALHNLRKDLREASDVDPTSPAAREDQCAGWLTMLESPATIARKVL